jgi:hypothetical protein
MGKRQTDEIAVGQSVIFIDGAQGRRDCAIADIDAAVNTFVTGERSRFDGKTYRCRNCC